MAGLPSNLRGLLQQFGGMGVGPPNRDQPMADTSEQVYISSLALLKMLKHGRAGVPMEVMGLMLGEFIDDYTVRVVDVFSMPQSGNSVSVEAVDPVYQTEMLEQLKRTGRPEMVVGWYHSHPGFGCWFSGQELRQTTSNIGHLQRPTISALVHGLNRNYYAIVINYRKNELENQMLLNLHRNKWNDALKLKPFDEMAAESAACTKSMKELSEQYNKMVQEEIKKTPEQLVVERAGKVDAKKRLENDVDTLMTENILHSLGTMIDTLVF